MNKRKETVGFVSLGCPKNQIDTEVMLHELLTAGYEITADDINADVIIINTCAFIESAKRESIDNILDVAWLKNNRNLKAIIVSGCMAQRYRDEIATEMPEVDGIIGTGSLHNIVEAVDSVLEGKKYISTEPNETLVLGGDRIVTTPEYTAYIKVAEGCDNRCSYCAIPDIRGGMRSRTIEDIVAEAITLEELGVKELIVIAQDTSRYGLDIYGEYRLAALLREILAKTSIPWIRLMYCYPDKITDELIALMKDEPRIVKYLDLPIQHISDSVLGRMNRHGGSKMIKETVAKLRKEIPDITLRTTAIVGFPGETDEDFSELCEYIGEAKFDRFGAFTYSREEGTKAYDFEDQIDEQVKQDRCDIIMQEQQEIHERLNKKKIGKKITVLYEDFDPVAETFFGRSQADAPEIDGKVYFSAKKKLEPGTFVQVKITDAIDYDLYGEMIRVIGADEMLNK